MTFSKVKAVSSPLANRDRDMLYMQTHSTTPTEPRRWYKQFWPWFLIALPTAVVIASISTLIISVKHADKLVAKDYYKEGLAINRYLAQDRRAEELNLQAFGNIDDRGNLTLTVNSGDDSQTPATLGQQLKLRWQHPTDSARDFTTVLIREDRNRYAAHIKPTANTDPLGGRWYLTLEDFTTAKGSAQWRLKSQYRPERSGQIDFRAGDPL
ncbi:FixH family protein [Spongiibacter nanhainus]|uniref:FixH family protein n=1 Tax=Spongiibacter nanhainus TaxID=2794344 RepID=A0A7T4R2W4_9GAMM|nr:FixH family protein [Spongiibacter nanhainus]QQD19322.1 FixH family protein [Spongiibacter nanhainus]